MGEEKLLERFVLEAKGDKFIYSVDSVVEMLETAEVVFEKVGFNLRRNLLAVYEITQQGIIISVKPSFLATLDYGTEGHVSDKIERNFFELAHCVFLSQLSLRGVIDHKTTTDIRDGFKAFLKGITDGMEPGKKAPTFGDPPGPGAMTYGGTPVPGGVNSPEMPPKV